MRIQYGRVVMMTIVAAGLVAGGCESSNKSPSSSDEKFHSSWNEKFWNEEHEARIPHTLAEQQATLGAQMDPTLYACHFEGTALNGLGKAKLDSMLVDGGVSKIYIDTGKSNADAHRASVNAYLAAANRADGSVAIESGVAPAALAPAAPSISRMGKTENPGTSTASNQSEATNSGSGMQSN